MGSNFGYGYSTEQQRFLFNRVRNLVVETYGGKADFGIYSINDDLNLESHSGGMHEKLEEMGFTFIGKGYFSSIWALPKGMNDFAKEAAHVS